MRRDHGLARPALVMLGALAALGAVALLSVFLGTKATSLGQVIEVLRGHSGDPYIIDVVDARLQRTALAIVCGAALALSGALMQGVSQNPLADPGLLGVNAGAAAGMMTGTAFFGISAGTGGSLWLALVGGLIAAGMVTTVGAMGGSGANMVRLVLAGAVVAAVLTAYVQALALRLPTNLDTYRFWVVGSFSDGGLDRLKTIAPFVVIAVIGAVAVAGALNAVALGSEAATALGVNAGGVRLVALVSATVLAAAATAAAGPIVFIGLAVPHLVRALVGLDMRRQVLGALLIGPVLLVGADVVGRVVIRPDQLMVGVVTAFVGAPVLLLTVRRLGSRA